MTESAQGQSQAMPSQTQTHTRPVRVVVALVGILLRVGWHVYTKPTPVSDLAVGDQQ